MKYNLLKCSGFRIKVWSLNSGDCLQALEGHTDLVTFIKVLSFERFISGSDNGELRIWCLETNGCIKINNAKINKSINFHLFIAINK